MRSISAMTVMLLATTASATEVLYVSVAGEKRIAVYQIDPAKGGLTFVADVTTPGEPGALTTDPQRRFLFAALRSTGELGGARTVDGDKTPGDY